MNGTTERRMLVEAWRSGQVPEAAWQEHLRDDPDLRDEWIADGHRRAAIGRIGEARPCDASHGAVCAAVAIVIVAAMLGLGVVSALSGGWRP